MAADELNCSDGAKMLIERMQSNPEEFKNEYDGRWRDILDCARTVVNDDEHSELISKRDAKAIMAAYDAHILEARLAERIINELMEPKKSKAKDPKSLLTAAEMNRITNEMLQEQYRKYEYEARQREFEIRQRVVHPRPWEKI
jgi:hypothetical protein